MQLFRRVRCANYSREFIGTRNFFNLTYLLVRYSNGIRSNTLCMLVVTRHVDFYNVFYYTFQNPETRVDQFLTYPSPPLLTITLIHV